MIAFDEKKQKSKISCKCTFKRGERVRLIPPSLSPCSSSSNLHLAAFLVFLDGCGVGVGVESVVFGVECVGVGGAGGAGEAGCRG